MILSVTDWSLSLGRGISLCPFLYFFKLVLCWESNTIHYNRKMSFYFFFSLINILLTELMFASWDCCQRQRFNSMCWNISSCFGIIAFLMGSQRKECISANYSMVEIKHYYELWYNLHNVNIVILYYIQLFLFPLFESLCQQTIFLRNAPAWFECYKSNNSFVNEVCKIIYVNMFV